MAMPAMIYRNLEWLNYSMRIAGQKFQVVKCTELVRCDNLGNLYLWKLENLKSEKSFMVPVNSGFY